MSNISGKINLAALEHKVIKTQQGTDCIVIPIKNNHLFMSEKGNVYLDIQANEHIDTDKKTTHIVNQSLPKDVYEQFKKDNKYAPTLGNLTDWSKLQGGGESAPNSSDVGNIDTNEDLPF